VALPQPTLSSNIEVLVEAGVDFLYTPSKSKDRFT
jgi:hypothetical protein